MTLYPMTNVLFVWVRIRHTGIESNDFADLDAKEASEM